MSKMEVQLINEELLKELHDKATVNERLRQIFDLRTTAEDGSQRMLNAIEPESPLPIHRPQKTSETMACLRGKHGKESYSFLSTLTVDDYERLRQSGRCASFGKFLDSLLGGACPQLP